MKRLIVIAMAVLLSSSIALAQDFCKGDFNFDGNVDANDVAIFMNEFGRSHFHNPCPTDGPTPPPKTGQTTSYDTGDDGDLERGVELVTPRFTDNLDGTVTDNQTGLIWLKLAYCFSWKNWNDALSACTNLENGQCGLTDGSNAGDWRLPNFKELFSLIDVENLHPVLPTGHPFVLVQTRNYWSSTTSPLNSEYAFLVSMGDARVQDPDKSLTTNVWCVRGGH